MRCARSTQAIIALFFVAAVIGCRSLPANAESTQPRNNGEATTVIADEHELNGYASWYGGKFQGRLTASGEPFDTNLLTAAHKTLPFDTIVEVTHLENGRSVVVRINDRGPFVDGRVIDLSRAAADALDMAGQGVAEVRIAILGREEPIFLIQLGSFGLESNAVGMQNRVVRAGFEATIEETGELYRVIVPNVPESAVGEYRERLADAGFTSLLVRRAPNSPDSQRAD